MATYETTTTITITMLVTTTTTTTEARAAEGTRRGGYTELCARRHEISDRAKTSTLLKKERLALICQRFYTLQSSLIFPIALENVIEDKVI